MTTKIDVSKLKKRPCPAGHKMRYQHLYATTDGRRLYQEDGTWLIRDSVAGDGDPIDYAGTRRLVGTVAWLETDAGTWLTSATALCNPKDTPIKKLGVTIAHNRCIKQFEALHHAVSS